MAFRVTFMMRQYGFGWTETWWNQATSLTQLVPRINNYVYTRSACMNTFAEWRGVRVSTEGAAKSGRLFLPGMTEVEAGGGYITIPDNGSGDVAFANGSDQARVAMHLEVISGSSRVSLRYFCTVPDRFSGGDATGLLWVAIPAWKIAFDAYGAQLKSGAWQIKARTPAGGALDHKIAGWELQDAPPNNLVAVLKPGEAVAAAQGDEVIVRGVKMMQPGMHSPNGVWVVESVAAAGNPAVQRITLRLSGAFGPSTFKKLGWIRIKEPVYVSVDLVRGLRIGVHKRANPLDRIRGRRSTRV